MGLQSGLHPQSLKGKVKSTKFQNKPTSSKTSGVLVILGALLLLAFWAWHTDPTRSKLVEDDFKTVSGSYSGSYLHSGSKVMVLETADGPREIYLNKGLVLNQIPMIGDQVQVTVTADPNFPKLISAQDLRITSGETRILLPKNNPSLGWLVQNGYAENGDKHYPTQIPNGEYWDLHAIKMGGQWCATY